jgi:hypothetical protein
MKRNAWIAHLKKCAVEFKRAHAGKRLRQRWAEPP